MKLLVVGDFQGKFPRKLEMKLRNEEFDLIVGVGDYGGIDDWKPWLKTDFDRSKKGLPRVSSEDFFGKKRFKELVRKDNASAKKVFRKISKLKKKFIFVYGNGDDYWYNHPEWWRNRSLKKQRNFLKKFNNFKEITYGKTSINGTDFIGFGGYMDIDAYFNTEDLKYQTKKMVKRRQGMHNRMRKKFFKLLNGTYKRDNENDKIFIFHYPPTGVFDIIKGGWKGNPMKGKSSGVRFYAEAIKKYKPMLVLCGHMHEYQGMKKLHGVLVINPGDAGAGKYAIVDLENEKVNARFK